MEFVELNTVEELQKFKFITPATVLVKYFFYKIKYIALIM